MAEPPGKIFGGRYKIVRKIGDGAMGDVYEVIDILAGNARFALKILKRHLSQESNFTRRFQLEASALNQISHPNIVHMHRFFEEDGDACLLLEFVEGQSLGDRIKRNGPLPIDEALRIFKGVLTALDSAHQAGIIHRDVKPSNILIDKQGVPKLCDFGIARQVGARGLTETGIALGTPHYMSPEQIKTPLTVDHRTDVYSAGIVLFEMLTGKVPFGQGETDSAYAILKQQIEATPPDPRSLNPALPPWIAEIVGRALRKDRNKRTQGCSEFRRAIQAFQDGDDPREAHRTSPQPPGTASQRRSTPLHMYRHSTGAIASVRSGFSWPALFFSVFWLWAQGLHSKAALWLGSMLGLLVLIYVTTKLGQQGAPALTYLLIAVSLVVYSVPGILGHRWIEEELQHSGFEFVGEVSPGHDGPDEQKDRASPPGP